MPAFERLPIRTHGAQKPSHERLETGVFERSSRAHPVERLSAGGSTNGAAGIELAYDLATEQLRPGAVNRVILATDGDFNVGITDHGSLRRLIEKKRDRGIFLTVLGFGMGNLKDATMELLADHGNGNYAYIDTLREARKVLVDQAASTLRTVARDTKIQLEFNPERVARYRLIGYENRRLSARDFDDDKKDAGEMGAGHTVTALYELELRGEQGRSASPLALRYQRARQPTRQGDSDELALVKVRYQPPEGGRSRLLTTLVRDRGVQFGDASEDLRFAAAVAGFGMILRDSPHRGDLGLDEIAEIADDARGRDRHGYRREFVGLVERAGALLPKRHALREGPR